jgi:hypothetical protein
MKGQLFHIQEGPGQKGLHQRTETLEIVYEELVGWGFEAGTELFDVGVLLLTSYMYGTNRRLLGQVTGFDPDYVIRVGNRLEKAEIWVGDGVDSEEWWGDYSKVEFLLAVMVGTGEVVRSWDETVGAFRYQNASKEPDIATMTQ